MLYRFIIYQSERMEMYDNDKHLEDTFTESNLSPYLLQAQWSEFIELKKAISEIYYHKNDLISILDIGIWDARIIKNLFPIEELWSKIKQYDWIDIAENCIKLSKEVFHKLGIADKTTATLEDATNIDQIGKKYDIILSTRFTVWNFYPTNFDFDDFKPWYDMSENDKFSSIFEKAYNMLNDEWEIIIGSVYIDNEATRKKQEQAYKDFWWTVITDERDCFTASQDGRWSQRFTKQRVYGYLDFIPQEKIEFIPLDTYNYAMMIRIKK